MNRTIKEATVKRFFYDTHEQLKAHLSDFIAACNFARRLKTPSRSHTLRSHLQTLDPRPRQVYTRPNPPNAGTKHLMQTVKVYVAPRLCKINLHD
jgi:hypothetical protein